MSLVGFTSYDPHKTCFDIPELQQQTESLKVQEKALGDAMKACERTWSQRYSECHKTVMTLVAEQDSLLKEKLEKVTPNYQTTTFFNKIQTLSCQLSFNTASSHW